jgi:pimeloyl-ACP methyl ester carboxylesterase
MRAVGIVLFALCLAGPAAGEEQVSFDVPQKTLQGTLLVAAQHAPAALIIAGSGPTDRDGNSPLGVRANSYRLLAEGLAAQGVTTLRYDKRGTGATRDVALKSESDMRIDTFADDARAAAALLRHKTGARCVWLIGHSEGALLAEMAARTPHGICGLVLISGAGVKAGDTLRRQVQTALPQAMRPAALAALDELEAGQLVDNPPPPAVLFRRSLQPYLISWFQQDPTKLLSRQKLPVLILQGSFDLQIEARDAQLLAAAKPDAKLVLLPQVNHVLKVTPQDPAANAATYGDPSLPLAPGIVDAIVDFLHGHAP